MLGTSFVLWLPLLMEGASLQALKRCFPVARGVFEDKVGNAWYAAQVFLRARDRLDQSSFIKAAAVLTALCSFAPCLLRCRRVARGQDRSLANILRSLHVSALAFFLFSYHVHEKGILVPLYPLLPLRPPPAARQEGQPAVGLRRAGLRRGVFSVIGVHAASLVTLRRFGACLRRRRGFIRPRVVRASSTKGVRGLRVSRAASFYAPRGPAAGALPGFVSGARRVVGRGRLRPRLRGGGAARGEAAMAFGRSGPTSRCFPLMQKQNNGHAP